MDKRSIDEKNVDVIVAAAEAKKLMSKKTNKKAMGGKIQTEYRGGGAVNLGNFKGQF